MTEISSLPEEVVLHIFTFLPTRDLITTAWKVSEHWRNLSRRPLATRIQSSLADSSYNLCDDEMDISSDLVTTGYLSEVGMKNLATRIQGSWSHFWSYYGSRYPRVTEVRCAATLARLSMPSLLGSCRSLRRMYFTSVRWPVAARAAAHLTSVTLG